jgi:hypothetical protein
MWIAFVLIVGVGSGSGAPQQNTGGASPKKNESCSSRNRKASFTVSSIEARHLWPCRKRYLTEIGEKSGSFEVVCSQDSRKMITKENLDTFNAVFFYTTGSLPLSATQKADLLDFVRKGGGFGGTHSASDTFYDWPEYGKLIGGYFDGHPWHQKIKVVVEDPDASGNEAPWRVVRDYRRNLPIPHSIRPQAVADSHEHGSRSATDRESVQQARSSN